MRILKEHPNIKGMIFDLDGTLLDSMSIWEEVDKKYLAKYGIPYKSCYSDDIKGLTFHETALYFIKNFNINLPPETIKQQWNEMVEEEYRSYILCKAGVIHFLESLYNNGIKMCIATSCNKKHAMLALQRLKLNQYFMFIKTSDEVGKNKEYPDLFEQCAKDMSLNNEECFVVEDLYSALKVAHDAGFFTIASFESHQVKFQNDIQKMCNYYVDTFEELI